MVYDSQFYFKKKGIDAVYSHEPQGTFDVIRLTKGLPPWKQTTLSSSQQPKALVFSDWTASSWSKAKVWKMQEKFRALKNDGFPLFIWLQEEVIPMTEGIISQLDEPNFLKKITPVSPNDLIQQAVEQQNMTYDEVMSLDDYWVSYLENDNVLPGIRVLSLKAILEIYLDSKKLENFFRLVNQAVPPYDYIANDEISVNIHPVKALVKENLSALPELFDVKDLLHTYKNQFIEMEYHRNEPEPVKDPFKWVRASVSLACYSDAGCLAKYPKPPGELMTFDMGFVGNITESQNDLMSREIRLTQHYMIHVSHSIETLEFEKYYPIDFFEQVGFDKKGYSELKFFRAPFSAISAKGLESILNGSPKLLALDLSKCQGYGLIPDTALKNTSLEIIIFNYVGRNAEPLALQSMAFAREKLLSASPLLKKLVMQGPVLMKTGFAERLNLSKLEVLDLEGSDISPDDFHQLIKKAPHLRALNISGVRHNLLAELESMNLTQFETIILSGSACYSSSQEYVEAIQKLIKKMPNLKLLDLSDVPANETAAIDFSNMYFKQLERYKFPEEEFLSFSQIQQRFNAAPCLSKYHLMDVKDSSSQAVEHPIHNEHLQKLEITASELSSAQFSSLLEGAARLRSLKIIDGKITGTDFDISPLLRLENIEISSSNIETPIIERLIDACPHLRRLSFDDSIHRSFSQSPLREPLNLSSLEYLLISSRKLKQQDLLYLLSNAKNLRSLDLNGMDMPGPVLSSSRFPVSAEMLDKSAFDAEFEPILETLSFPHLEVLNIGEVSFNILQSILSSSKKLKRLSLFGRLYPHLSADFSSLEYISIQKATFYLTEDRHNPSLRKLLKSSSKTLRYLHLPETSRIWGRDVFKDLYFPNLQTLMTDGENPGDIDRDSLRQLLKAGPNLQSLSFDVETTIPLDEEIRAFLKKIPNINLMLKKSDIDDPKNDKSQSAQAASSSSLSTPAPLPVSLDNPHNPVGYIDFIPADRNKPFLYRGQKRILNQDMIVEQLSQYLTVTKQKLDIIPRIQDGICLALSTLFKEKSLEDWQAFLSHVSTWDGSASRLDTHMIMAFEALTVSVLTYQFSPKRSRQIFVGEGAWAAMLNNTKGGYVITNPWHAIAVKYDVEQGHWLVYDPNYIEGYKTCSGEQLEEQVQRSLGYLIIIKDIEDIEPQILYPDSFIEEGGLLSLCYVDNFEKMLLQLPSAMHIHQNSYIGMFLRDNHGIPAWVKAINSTRTEVKYYAKLMLETFVCQHPTNWQRPLQRSVACMSEASIHHLMANLLAFSSPKPSVLFRAVTASVCDMLRNRPMPDDVEPPLLKKYKTALQTWSRDITKENNPKVFCQNLFKKAPKNQLIELADSKAVDVMGLLIQEYCNETARECFYIDSPEELVCSADFIRKEGKKGYLCKGPGGALHDFLSKEQQAGEPDRVLLINYDNFDANDLVIFNTLLDKKRRADNTDVPSSVKIIGLINPNKPGSYKGSDFYSRFGRIQKTRLGLGQELEKPLSQSLPEAYSINLFHAPDWKEQLLGHWEFKKNVLSFRSGKLIKALKKGKQLIQIENGLWSDREFCRFWETARRLRYIEHAGQRIPIPAQFQWVRKDEYNWHELAQNIHFLEGLSSDSDAVILNPSVFSEWFVRYRCDNKHRMNTLPGWLSKQHSGKTYKVNLTRELNEDEWARVADACKQFEIKLQCHVADGLMIPAFFQTAIAASSASSSSSSHFEPPRAWAGESEGDLLIQSSDPDSTVAALTADNPADWLVLDISGFESSDFIRRLQSDILQGEKHPYFVFSETELVLIQGLKEGKKLLLKGAVSPSLSDALTAIFLERSANAPAQATGQLVLITESAKYFHALPTLTHEVSPEQKQDLLLQQGYSKDELDSLSLKQCQEEPLSRLQTRLNFWRHQPDASSDEAWQGMFHLDAHVMPGAFNPETSPYEAREFQERRLRAVLAILEHAPYVYLSGLTAVGKTSFVENSLCGEKGQLYLGEQEMETFVNAAGEGMKFLFIDEANLAKMNFNHFEGLYAPLPYLLVKGKCYPLTPQHKLVFAGNPLSYGEGRTMPDFFKRHGNALVFEPLSQAFIYENVLKPLFANIGLEQQAVKLSSEILQAYSFLCRCSTDRVLISPRELQMIALLAIADYKKKTQGSLDERVRHYIRQLARPLVPVKDLSDFDKQFRSVKTPPLPEAASSSSSAAAGLASQAGCPLGKHFWLSRSRVEAADMIHSWLDLREYRQNSSNLNDSQQYGGLGALVLEGSPAAGKSELLIALLRARGFMEVKEAGQSIPQHAFYRMPVSMRLEEKKALLLNAFHAGAVVLVDELNSSPMLERFMNALLMGKNPEAKQDEPLRPRRAGFMLFATQNPVSMQGRIKAGEALLRRQQNISLPDYNASEVRDILIHKGFHPEHAGYLADAFIQQVSKAKNENLNPSPTLRDVIRLEERFSLRTASARFKMVDNKAPVDQRLFKHKALAIESLKKYIKIHSPSHPARFFSLNPQVMQALEQLLYVIDNEPIEEYEMQLWHHHYYDKLSTDEYSWKHVQSIFKLLEVTFEPLPAENRFKR